MLSLLSFPCQRLPTLTNRVTSSFRPEGDPFRTDGAGFSWDLPVWITSTEEGGTPTPPGRDRRAAGEYGRHGDHRLALRPAHPSQRTTGCPCATSRFERE